MDYFRDLYNRFVVTFYDKTIQNDQGFALTLNQRMGYPEVCQENMILVVKDSQKPTGKRSKNCHYNNNIKKRVIPPRIEPGTLSVLDSRDNHYTTESL